MSSSDQVARLLALVPYLQQHPDAPLPQVAEHFGVTPRQLVADLKVLWYCGLPGGGMGDLIEVDMDALDAGRIRLSNAEYLSRPLRLTLDEATSLAVGLRALQELAPAAFGDAVASALAKIEAVVGQQAPVDVALVSGEEAVRTSVSGALASGRAMRLRYQGASRDEETTPTVDPARISVRDGYTYLDAWSRDRDAWRSFRLDRILAAEVLGDAADDHGEPPPEASGWLDHRPDAVEVSLEVSAQGAWIAEYVPVRQVTPTVDGGVAVTLLVADPAWFRRLLLRLGPSVLRVEPAEAAASARQAARDALARYA